MYILYKTCSIAPCITGTPFPKGARGGVLLHTLTCPPLAPRCRCARVAFAPPNGTTHSTENCTHGGDVLHCCLYMYLLHKTCPIAPCITGTSFPKGARGAVHYCRSSHVRRLRRVLTLRARRVCAALGTARSKMALAVVTCSTGVCACTYCTKHVPLRHASRGHPFPKAHEAQYTTARVTMSAACAAN